MEPNLLALKIDAASVRLVQAGQDLHQRRLTGAVVADQPENLTAPYTQIDISQRDHGTEAHCDSLGPQHILDACSPVLPDVWRHDPTFPFPSRAKFEKTELTARPNDPCGLRMVAASSICGPAPNQ
jgi:hypothetical protein